MIAASEVAWPGSMSSWSWERDETRGLVDDGEGERGLSWVLGLLALEAPKERVFWAPLAAGPVEVRARRVGGIFVVVS